MPVPGVQPGASVQEVAAQHWFPPLPGTQRVGSAVAAKIEVVVTAMWKSIGSSPRPARAVLVWTMRVMKSWKLAARPACFGSIDGESSTTKRMSALETPASFTFTAPGWIRQWPTGLKL